MRRRISILVMAVLALIMIGQPTGADAAPRTAPQAQRQLNGWFDESLHWQPYRSETIDYPAGQNCAFAVRGVPVKDEEETAIPLTFPDGSPRLQLFRGDLSVRFSNLGTGRSAVVSLNGRGAFLTGSDGSTTIFADGPFSIGFRPGDGHPAGIWRLAGIHVVRIAPESASRTVLLAAGPERNICNLID